MSNRSYCVCRLRKSIIYVNFQFPVGMSNRSYIYIDPTITLQPDASFQFPVGMSNRSYCWRKYEEKVRGIINFQFPVGMSNRSYTEMGDGLYYCSFEPAFNSPWECRIGLTSWLTGTVLEIFRTFNSPWECRIGLTKKSPI